MLVVLGGRSRPLGAVPGRGITGIIGRGLRCVRRVVSPSETMSGNVGRLAAGNVRLLAALRRSNVLRPGSPPDPLPETSGRSYGVLAVR